MWARVSIRLFGGRDQPKTKENLNLHIPPISFTSCNSRCKDMFFDKYVVCAEFLKILKIRVVPS